MENIVQGQWFRGPSADLGDEIAQSLRFNASGYLTRAQTSSGDGLISSNRTFTFSTWIKLGQFSGSNASEHNIFGIPHSGSNENWLISLSSETFSDRHNEGGSSSFRAYDSTAKFRDPHAWYHLFLTYSSNVGTLRVNNVLMDTARGQSSGMDRDFWIGSEANGGSPMQAYLAETYFIQGTAMNAVNDGFIRLNEDGVYVPDTPTISSYGTNGFHLTYDSSQSNGIGHDSSGNGNHFTANNFETTALSSSNFDNDIDYKDTPTNNCAILNPLIKQPSSHSHSEALLRNTDSNGSYPNPDPSTMILRGKKYWEVELISAAASYPYLGICKAEDITSGGSWYSSGGGTAYFHGAGYNGWVSNPTNTIGNTTNGDVIGIAFDRDTRQCTFTRNGGTGQTVTAPTHDGDWCAMILNAVSKTCRVNFGQRPFRYTPPTGYTGLVAAEYPEPTIKNGKDHFEALTYTGDGQSSKTITGLNFKPDLVWIKPRSVVDNHRIIDSVLEIGGGTLASNSTDAKSGQSVLSSFNNDGFTLSGTDSGWNGNTSTYVAWCWKAGGAPTTDNTNSAGAAQTAGSVKVDGSNGSFAQGSIAVKKMSVNTTAGFSIVEYEGTGSAGTFPHGLGATPEWAILKRHDGTGGWSVYHESMGNQNKMELSSSNQMSNYGTGTDFWNGTSPTNQVFSIGVAGAHNTDNEQYIAYLWAPVEGYSKFGEYTGNGNANGQFVYLGFKPAYVLVKTKSGANGSWSIYDSARQPQNPNTNTLVMDSTAADVTSGNDMDFLSNGFKCRDNGSINNGSSNVYLYMAFAENPFGGENQPPVTAV